MFFSNFIFFYSRMCSEGFPFIFGVWGWTCVRVVLVASSSCRRHYIINFSPLGGTHAQPFPAKDEKWRTSRTKCSFWRSQGIKWEVIFAFRVIGTIFWKCVNASASFFGGRHSTFWCGLSRCRGRCNILWRGEDFFSTNRSVRDAQGWHYFKYRGRRSIWWVSWKVAEASQKLYFLNFIKMTL